MRELSVARQGLALLASLTLVVVACSDRGEDARSGFLGDYSELKAGRGDQAQLVYIDTGADFSRYERILLDPVVVWEASDAPAEELRRLAVDLEKTLRAELAREFLLVERTRPDTLRIRTALTGVHASGASIEMEILDAESGQRLVAVADTREPETAPETGEWASAREAFAFWARRARVRLAAFRSFDASEAAHSGDAPETN